MMAEIVLRMPSLSAWDWILVAHVACGLFWHWRNVPGLREWNAMTDSDFAMARDEAARAFGCPPSRIVGSRPGNGGFVMSLMWNLTLGAPLKTVVVPACNLIMVAAGAGLIRPVRCRGLSRYMLVLEPPGCDLC